MLKYNIYMKMHFNKEIITRNIHNEKENTLH